MFDPLWAVVLTALTEMLGASAFSQRQAASAALVRFAPLSWPHLVRANLTHDPEMQKRARHLMAEIDPWLALGPHDYPWIDSLPDDWPDRKAIIESYLEKTKPLINGRGSWHNGWPQYRAATWMWTEDLRRDGWPLADRRELLRLLRTGDKRQTAKYLGVAGE